MRQAAKAYFETQLTTTSPAQLLLMLYDGAIKYLIQAKEQMALKDYAAKGLLISKAIAVINELASSLNVEKGGDFALNMSELYFYCNKRLFLANSRMEPAMIDEVMDILGKLREAYASIADKPEVVAAMAAATPSAAKGFARTPIGTQTAYAGAGSPARAKVHNAYASQAMMPVEAVPSVSCAEAGTALASAAPDNASASTTSFAGQKEPATASPQQVPAASAKDAEPELPSLPPLAEMAGQSRGFASPNKLFRKFSS